MPIAVTPELAAAIVEAFGPCTALYECGGAEHVQDCASRADSVQDMVQTLLDCEGIQAERMDDTGDCYREWKEARFGVLGRLWLLDPALRAGLR